MSWYTAVKASGEYEFMNHSVVQPWHISDQDFPSHESSTQKLQFLLNYAVLAPSGHNTQPWKFRLQSETLELWADLSRALPRVDPNHRELIISCGAALMNLRLALHHFGYCGEIQLLPDPTQPTLLAQIQLGDWGHENTEDRTLFDAIQKRHTNRQPFQDWDISETVLKWLQNSAVEEGTWLHLIQSEEERSHILGFVNLADHLQMSDPHIRQELADWMHSSHHPNHDGLPAYALGVPEQFDFLTTVLSWLTRFFDLGNRIAQQDETLLQSASTIAVLGTDGDTSEHWLRAGQALEKVLLRAQSLGIVASFFNAPIQMADVRSQLQQSLNREGYPQVLLRLGYAQPTQSTPRRSSHDVLF
ncbi:Acg family FMN-binding oxidoreductase [Leptolyngbya sp. AN03gr2]|uniref:Acg family FMN-binding oxidoreductase n=1 Tax=unclassified Leptolyngbya TaxID=2650499 RepID=UPI003D31407A